MKNYRGRFPGVPRAAETALLMLALLCAGGTAAARAQVAESATSGPISSVSAYGLASADQRQFGYAKTLGWSAGLTLTHGRHFGLTGEGSEIKWRSPIHDYTALAGPRYSLSSGRLQLFGEGLVGLGHASYLVTRFPRRKATQTFGLAYGVAAGIDLRVTRHFSWRVVQANYTHISVGPNGVHPLTGSTGIVYRF